MTFLKHLQLRKLESKQGKQNDSNKHEGKNESKQITRKLAPQTAIH